MAAARERVAEHGAPDVELLASPAQRLARRHERGARAGGGDGDALLALGDGGERVLGVAPRDEGAVDREEREGQQLRPARLVKVAVPRLREGGGG